MIDLELLALGSPQEIQNRIAANVRRIRRRRKISQRELASRSGVSYASLRRFESEGEISLASLAKIAITLGLEQELAALFSATPYLSVEEIENERK